MTASHARHHVLWLVVGFLVGFAARAEVGDAAWEKEGREYVAQLPPLAIPDQPTLKVGPKEQYQDVATAIAALPAEGGTIRIAQGAYEIKESLRVPSHVALIGEGPETRIQMKERVLAHVITNADHAKGNQQILIRDLAVVGNLDSQGKPPVGHPTQGNDNCRGIYLDRVTKAYVLNCFITETGTNSLRADNSQDVVVANNAEKHCFHCLNFTNCKAIVVAYNRVVRKWSGEAPYFNNTCDSQVFRNCVEGMGMDGMAFDFQSSRNNIHDNMVVASALSGILLCGNAGDNKVRDNTIKSSGRYKKNPQDRVDGIYLRDASRNTIAGNRCVDDQPTPTQRYGIYISNAACQDNIVSGNTFSGNTAGEIKDLGANTRLQE
ncbi:MAG: right-handed parallel beta-helix repeat-containing protein [Planctomycetota bacterium]|nr:right-handed parallel beta-helix repeat-containing protein [Planctomycetota bacterium]